jgi:hypothetical protein
LLTPEQLGQKAIEINSPSLLKKTIRSILNSQKDTIDKRNLIYSILKSYLRNTERLKNNDKVMKFLYNSIASLEIRNPSVDNYFPLKISVAKTKIELVKIIAPHCSTEVLLLGIRDSNTLLGYINTSSALYREACEIRDFLLEEKDKRENAG